ncbi:hypothetical protein ACFVVL_00650 [Kitasatospora sp. NPDC058115]|uniref:hypothetical protein n=1 Tax=Kitasatospora sp. NPDC058115 TaxID=3346347 RepID=UPI0036DA180F
MPTRRQKLLVRFVPLAAAALAASLAAAGLGVLVLRDGDRCGSGQEARLAGLAGLEELRLAPAGVRPDGEAVSTECVDGDGENLLVAAVGYDHPGSPVRVQEYYAAELTARGWTPGRATRIGEACYTRHTAAGPTVLRVGPPDARAAGDHYALVAGAAIEGEADCSW